ncbi:hypothetical protein [Curtobacterium sp. MCBD17_032]|uniref:hypothetical protein n=1 Tax=Curtobacterium sp. MCBD17_032 TaxID=2175659 RepID=UPI000DAA78D1|nr:hypothetical protein [Curtobacterium sp. MCBD17_032]PZE81709.1 hypothetical protein DEI91_12440 [Curtobacterium sp. MCBD17_032]
MTPTTDHLTGTWAPDATAVRTGGASPAGDGPPVPARSAAETPTTGPVTPPDVVPSSTRPGGAIRSGRRVTTRPVPGSDPTPAPEPARHAAGENDDRLLRDRPPHWQ